MSLNSSHGSTTTSLAIASGKGGTGKTLITASLGAVLARLGFSVLVVDTDLFTCGLSYYLLGNNPRRVKLGLQDCFLQQSGNPETDLSDIPTVPIRSGTEPPVPFEGGELCLLPAISHKRPRSAELVFTSQFNLERLTKTLMDARILWAQSYDFVLFDTRGGTDISSVASCLAAEAYVIVTEADKTSWDLGSVLIEAIVDGDDAIGQSTTPLGFVINKNVLPPDAIEMFLRKLWEMPHLATCPIDLTAIADFQTDRIPVVSTPLSAFSANIYEITARLFIDKSCDEDRADTIDELIQASHLTTAQLARWNIIWRFVNFVSMACCIALTAVIAASFQLNPVRRYVLVAIASTAAIMLGLRIVAEWVGTRQLSNFVAGKWQMNDPVNVSESFVGKVVGRWEKPNKRP